MVVELVTEAGPWVANFRSERGGIELAQLHPNRRDAVVIAAGDLWIVNPLQRSAELLLSPINAALVVQDPDGWVFSWQGLALVRFGPEGIVWHTRRLSWDGFDELSIVDGMVTGVAWSAIGSQWQPFQVELSTGQSTGGSYSDSDDDGWERLAE